MCDFRFQNCFKPTPLMSTMLLLCEMGVSGWFLGIIEQKGCTKVTRFSYETKRRRFLVDTLGDVVLASLSSFSYWLMLLVLSGATSKT